MTSRIFVMTCTCWLFNADNIFCNIFQVTFEKCHPSRRQFATISLNVTIDINDFSPCFLTLTPSVTVGATVKKYHCGSFSYIVKNVFSLFIRRVYITEKNYRDI